MNNCLACNNSPIPRYLDIVNLNIILDIFVFWNIWDELTICLGTDKRWILKKSWGSEIIFKILI